MRFIAIALLLGSCTVKHTSELPRYVEYCIDGIAYLVFEHGVSVKYTDAGSVYACDFED